MRYIDTRGLGKLLTTDWKKNADKARRDIATATDPATRAKAIAKHAHLWATLKPVLARLSHDKCWYCECHVPRSANAVDHFRPKSAIYEDTTHDGYWWLAFESSNFRFSCELCNSYGSSRTRSIAGGKRTHFPLVDPSTRIRDPAGNVEKELALLLDPTVRADPSLLWFDPDGTAVPDPRLTSNSVPYRRACSSSDIYNLNEARIKDARLKLSNSVYELVKEADLYWSKVETGDPTAHKAFERTVERLCALASSSEEFSAAAHSALMRLRPNSVVPDLVLKEL